MLKDSSKQLKESRNYSGINQEQSSICSPETQYLIAGRRIMYMNGSGSIRLLQQFGILKTFTCMSNLLEIGQRL